jgi:hypothetical protein
MYENNNRLRTRINVFDTRIGMFHRYTKIPFSDPGSLSPTARITRAADQIVPKTTGPREETFF